MPPPVKGTVKIWLPSQVTASLLDYLSYDLDTKINVGLIILSVMGITVNRVK